MHAAASCPFRLRSWGLPVYTPTCPNPFVVVIPSAFCFLLEENSSQVQFHMLSLLPFLTLGIFHLCYFSHFALCLSIWVGLSYKRNLTIFPCSLAQSLGLYTAWLNHSMHSFHSVGRVQRFCHHAPLQQEITALQLHWLTDLGVDLSQESCVQKDSMAALNHKQMMEVCAMSKHHENALCS